MGSSSLWLNPVMCEHSSTMGTPSLSGRGGWNTKMLQTGCGRTALCPLGSGFVEIKLQNHQAWQLVPGSVMWQGLPHSSSWSFVGGAELRFAGAILTGKTEVSDFCFSAFVNKEVPSAPGDFKESRRRPFTTFLT